MGFMERAALFSTLWPLWPDDYSSVTGIGPERITLKKKSHILEFAFSMQDFKYTENVFQ